MKRFVKSNDDITAYGKCVGYGIDYRNMHNAIHGILVFSDNDDAKQCYDDLKQAEYVEDQSEYDVILEQVFDFAIDNVEEINYRDFRDVAGEEIYPLYDDEFIIIVNNVAVDLYL